MLCCRVSEDTRHHRPVLRPCPSALTAPTPNSPLPSLSTTIHPIHPLHLARQVHYGCRLGMVYVLHANWLFWTLYHAVLRPFLAVVSSRGYERLRLVQAKDDLLEYFEADQLGVLDEGDPPLEPASD